MIQKAQEVAAGLATDVVAGRLVPGDRVPGVRALAHERACSPGTAARAHRMLREAGVIAGPARAQAVVTPDGVARALAMSTDAGSARLCGSDDPALDMLLTAVGPAVERPATGQGSVAGLGMLAQGTVHAAAVHLRDVRTGRSNDTFVRRVIGGEPAMLVHLWSREQGLVVPKGNPRDIGGVDDLGGARMAWRAPGTGSRLLLTRLLRGAGVDPIPEGELCGSHLGVAVAVAAGAADAGLAVRSAAEAVDADLVPVEWEDFELAVDPDSMRLLAPVLDVLASTTVQDRVTRMAGYDLRRSGEMRVAA
jgi:molybdate-binding protein